MEAHEALARGHLLIRQSTFDPKARAVSGAGLVDRETGKLTWVADLGSSRNFALALFDGGVMVGDGRELKGYLAVDAERSQQKLEELKARVAKDPRTRGPRSVRAAPLPDRQGPRGAPGAGRRPGLRGPR